jgi:hypothetical protein
MSTRATVAEPHGDSWRGRHTHSDGYPTGRGRALWALVARDGLETVRQTIIHDHYGWSFIDPDMPSFEGVKPNRDAEFGTPEHGAYLYGPDGIYGDGRFVIVPGYGVAYTTAGPEQGVAHGPQSSEDDWYGPHEKWGTGDHEWSYVLADDGLWVFKCHFDRAEPTLVATVRWDGPEPNWMVMENTGELEAVR